VPDIHCHLKQLHQREIVIQYRGGYIPGLSQSLTGLGRKSSWSGGWIGTQLTTAVDNIVFPRVAVACPIENHCDCGNDLRWSLLACQDILWEGMAPVISYGLQCGLLHNWGMWAELNVLPTAHCPGCRVGEVTHVHLRLDTPRHQSRVRCCQTLSTTLISSKSIHCYVDDVLAPTLAQLGNSLTMCLESLKTQHGLQGLWMCKNNFWKRLSNF